eukprot:g77457.t1
MSGYEYRLLGAPATPSASPLRFPLKAIAGILGVGLTTTAGWLAMQMSNLRNGVQDYSSNAQIGASAASSSATRLSLSEVEALVEGSFPELRSESGLLQAKFMAADRNGDGFLAGQELDVFDAALSLFDQPDLILPTPRDVVPFNAPVFSAGAHKPMPAPLNTIFAPSQSAAAANQQSTLKASAAATATSVQKGQVLAATGDQSGAKKLASGATSAHHKATALRAGEAADEAAEFVPKSEEMDKVLIKPGPPGLEVLIPSGLFLTSCFFQYTSFVPAALKTGIITEGWVYGAKVTNKGGLATPTGVAEDIVKGQLICFSSSMMAEKLEANDGAFAYDPEHPYKGVLRRGLVDVVNRDGSTTKAVWYYEGNPYGVIRLVHGKQANTYAELHLNGGTVASWVVMGQENLFLTKKAIVDKPPKPVRGGIPLVFPQFGPGPIQLHGFARNVMWSHDGNVDVDPESGDVTASVALEPNEYTKNIWDYNFKVVYTVVLKRRNLVTHFKVFNADSKPFDFTTALHTYWRVDDINKVTISGLQGITYADRMDGGKEITEASDAIKITKETDSVYKNVPMTTDVSLRAGENHDLVIRRKNYHDIVLWNPWAETAKNMAKGDFVAEEYMELACVESAQVTPVHLEAGASWEGVQDVEYVLKAEQGFGVIKLVHGQEIRSTAEIHLNGGTITSWHANGHENLFLTKKAILQAPPKPIRGGIPLVFPQFGPGPIQQHGFARNVMWKHGGEITTDPITGDVSTSLVLTPNEYTRKIWDYDFECVYEITLKKSQVVTKLLVVNTDSKPWEFTTLLHTYWRVDNVHHATIGGLQGLTYVDRMDGAKEKKEESDAIMITQETDSVYKNVPMIREVNLRASDSHDLVISRDGYHDVVLWNPWVETAKGMAKGDFLEQEYKELMCVESGTVTPISLRPGQSWAGVQTVTSLPKGESKFKVIKLAHGKAPNTFAELHLNGGTVTSWVVNGQENLFLTKKAIVDKPPKPVRGGIPLVFPQFGPGPIQLHGFARNVMWTEGRVWHNPFNGDAWTTVTLTPNEYTKNIWDYDFKVEYTVILRATNLVTKFKVINKDSRPFDFTTALHTYWRVNDINKVTISGLQGITYADRMDGGKEIKENSDEVRIAKETDSVYKNVPITTDVSFRAGANHELVIRRKNYHDIVLWNPWAETAKNMAKGDFVEEEYKELVCVESAQVTPLHLKSGASWEGVQDVAYVVKDPKFKVVRLNHGKAHNTFAELHLNGGTVASWYVNGQENLFLTRKAIIDKPPKPVRGGIPLVFPQFGPGPIQLHGFARNVMWSHDGVVNHDATTGDVSTTVTLTPNEYTKGIWDHQFKVEYTVILKASNLVTKFKVLNTDSKPFDFTTALHTYWRVDDIDKVTISGLKGITYADRMDGGKEITEASDAIKITKETDSVYKNVPMTTDVSFRAGENHDLVIHRQNYHDIVLWNPWAATAKNMAKGDFVEEEYKQLVCVESAQVTPVHLEAGATWEGVEDVEYVPKFKVIRLTHGKAPRTFAELHLNGGTVASWVVNGQENLFLTKKAIIDKPPKPVRGGIPLVFPQFGPGPIQLHGFARNVMFSHDGVVNHDATTGDVSTTVTLTPNEYTKGIWDHDFKVEYTVVLKESNLVTHFKVLNTGSKPFDFTTALHTYWRVDDINKVTISGLQGITYADRMDGGKETKETSNAIKITKETDSVYKNVPMTTDVSFRAGENHELVIRRKNYHDIILWNPWAATAKNMAKGDFVEKEYKELVCVESGQVTPVHLEAGASWEGVQDVEYVRK